MTKKINSKKIKVCKIISNKKNTLIKNFDPKADDENVITDTKGIAKLTVKGKARLCNVYSVCNAVKYFMDGSYTKFKFKIDNENDAIIKATKLESGKVDMMSINTHDIKHIQGMIDQSLIPVYARLDNMEQKFDKKFDEMDTRLDNMEQKFDKKFDEMDTRLDNMEQKFDKKFDAIDKKFDEVNQTLIQILNKI